MADKMWHDVARVVVDAFDVDIQLFYSNLLEKFRNTPLGDNVAAYANKNPAAFEAFLRILSVAVQRLPKDHNILTETIADHLQRLPVELRRAMFGNITSSPKGQSSVAVNNTFDDSFNLRYEESLSGLSDEHLRQVASLERSKLNEWVNSPKQLRPFLLDKWKEEAEKGGQGISLFDRLLESMGNNWDENLKDLKKSSDNFLAKQQGDINQNAIAEIDGNKYHCKVKTPSLDFVERGGKFSVDTKSINFIRFYKNGKSIGSVIVTTQGKRLTGDMTTAFIEFEFLSGAKPTDNVLSANRVKKINFLL
jgi:hypothetical protein